MSQDTHLFSVRRPRETLGSLNYNSSIPQPASAIKRSNSISGLKDHQSQSSQHARSASSSRMSLAPSRPQQPIFQRSSSGTNLAEMGRSSIAQRSSSSQGFGAVSGQRMSYAPPSMMTPHSTQYEPQLHASTSVQRRSSVWSRPSTSGVANHQSFFASGPIPATVPRDPRALRNASQLARIAQELLDYLAQNNYELDVKRPLSQNTLKSPTQKDFDCIFQWLYKRLDPGYRFLRAMDQEIPPILKQLRYPYEKSITKSQISAVGGQNWGTFLGLLHWMMQLAVMLEKFNAGAYDDACAEAGVDVSGDRIIFRFLSGAYRDWLSVDVGEDEEDDSDRLLGPHIETMAAEFEAGNRQYLDEMKILEAENAALRQQMAEMERSRPNIEETQAEIKILESDVEKFEDYISKMKKKLAKLDNQIELLGKEIDEKDLEIEKAQKERDSLQEAVDRQKISIQDIDRMNAERDRLQKGLEASEQRLETLQKKIAEKEVETGSKLEELERAIERYNSLCYTIGLIPVTAPNAKGQDYELHLKTDSRSNFSASQSASNESSSRLLSDATTGYQPQQILSLDMRNTIKGILNQLRKEITKRRIAAKDADEENHRLLDEISEAIDDKRNEVEALEHRVRAAEEEFERTKEVTSTQKVESDAQIEKMERELGKLRGEMGRGSEVMEQREMNVNIEFEQLTIRANVLREELHTEIERMLNDIIKFKVHIQKSLEDYEGFVVEEVEMELGGVDEMDGEEGVTGRLDE